MGSETCPLRRQPCQALAPHTVGPSRFDPAKLGSAGYTRVLCPSSWAIHVTDLLVRAGEATSSNPFIDGDTEAQGRKGWSGVTRLGSQEEPSWDAEGLLQGSSTTAPHSHT